MHTDLLTGRGRRDVVACDDLSGACEVAGLLHQAGICTVVSPDAPVDGAAVAVVDLDARTSDARSAREIAARAVRDWPVAYLKLDSLVRGPVRAIVEGAATGDRAVLYCPALPELGRTISGGTFSLGGVALPRTDAWQLETRRAPTSVRELLGASAVAFDPVTGPRADHPVHYADAETVADLDALAESVQRYDMLAIGSAGLLGALVRRAATPDTSPDRADARELEAPRTVVVAVGSASTAAAGQTAELGARGTTLLELDPDTDDTVHLDRLRERVEADAPVALRWRTSAAGPDPSMAEALTARLSALVVAAVADDPRVAVALVGGATARSVVDALETRWLVPFQSVRHGSVLTQAPDGRVIAVRPGSFGSLSSLADLIDAIQSIPREKPQP